VASPSSEPTLVTVAACADCPFSRAEIEDESDEWLCTATEDREIGRTQPYKGAPWLPPPKWCPLRQADLVVRLAEAKTGPRT
jgi:hypothetical protein